MMSGIVLNWESAHAAARDAANRNMRARRAKNPRLRERWSVADGNVYVVKLEYLALLFFRSNYELPYGPVDLREAWMALSGTRGESVIAGTA